MARHRSDAPSAPRHAPVLDDPFGDPPFGSPRRGGDGWRPLDTPEPVAPAGGPLSFGLPAVTLPDPLEDPLAGPAARDVPAPRAPGSERAPWTGPVPRVLPAPRTALDGAPSGPLGVPGVAESRSGRHAWVDPEQAAERTVVADPVPAALEPPVAAAAPTARVSPVSPAPGAALPPVAPATGRTPAPSRARAGRGTARPAAHDPETTPLDLAAIALASARGAAGPQRPGTGGMPRASGRSGPLAVPATGGHRVAAGGGLRPSRAAGALAVAGALVSAGVAVLSSGSMLANADAPVAESSVVAGTDGR